MADRPILKRNEVPEEFTWNLKDLFESDEKWLEALEELKAFPAECASFAGKLGSGAETLLQFFKLQDRISLKLEAVISYASQKCDEDTGNSRYQDFRGRAMSAYAAIAAAAAFSDPEIAAIGEETLNGFYEACPDLAVYRRPIEKTRKLAAHILSDREEALLASVSELARTPSNVYGMLMNADLRFPEVTDSEGKTRPLTGGTLVPYLQTADRAFRKNVFETYYKRLGEFRNTAAATLDAEFKKRVFMSETRKFPDTLSAALDQTEVPVSVYHNLIAAVHNNMDSMYRYVALRKKLLGVDELHMYDVYAPIIEDASREIPFEQAKETVLEALSVLGTDYTDLLRTGFENRWIDVYENEGKRGGAYSSGNPFPHPYVLMNFKDDLSSTFTLAHEMGHSLHSFFSGKNQPVCTADYVIFVAEVASTVNEVLLINHLLSKTADKKERAYLINHFLDEFKGTVFRQTMFAEFELMLGRMAENHEVLTADALCQKYGDLNALYFGPDMAKDPEIALEWARIPHFYYNYYVFQYATGFSAAVAIANRILAHEPGAVEDYKRFLSGGSSADPISLLKIAGVDMSTEAPVRSALSFFGTLVDELDALT